MSYTNVCKMDVHPSSQETPVQHVYHIPALSQAVARIPTPRQLQWPKQFQWCHLPWRCWAELGIALGLLGRPRPLASTTSEARHAAGNSQGKEPSVRVSTWSNQGFWMTMSNHCVPLTVNTACLQWNLNPRCPQMAFIDVTAVSEVPSSRINSPLGCSDLSERYMQTCQGSGMRRSWKLLGSQGLAQGPFKLSWCVELALPIFWS